MQRHPFIVIYGANNLGKSEQVTRLARNLSAHKLKYPIYDLAPTGPVINAALREGLEISDYELQLLYAQNRRDFEPSLMTLLSTAPVVSEDYTGTGLAWGMTKGLDISTLLEMNKDLMEPDLAILLDGERFGTGIEREHRHEQGSEWETARQIHLELAEKFGWEIVLANRSREDVEKDILEYVIKSKFVS